jgi:hypothetical protein
VQTPVLQKKEKKRNGSNHVIQKAERKLKNSNRRRLKYQMDITTERTMDTCLQSSSNLKKVILLTDQMAISFCVLICSIKRRL